MKIRIYILFILFVFGCATQRQIVNIDFSNLERLINRQNDLIGALNTQNVNVNNYENQNDFFQREIEKLRTELDSIYTIKDKESARNIIKGKRDSLQRQVSTLGRNINKSHEKILNDYMWQSMNCYLKRSIVANLDSAKVGTDNNFPPTDSLLVIIFDTKVLNLYDRSYLCEFKSLKGLRYLKNIEELNLKTLPIHEQDIEDILY